MQLSDLRDPKYTPKDAQKLWGISPGMFNSYRMRGQVPATVVKAGKLRYSKFTVIQLCQLGVQFELVKQYRFPLAAATAIAAESAIEFEREFLRDSGELPQMPFAIVQSDPPRSFRVGLDDTLSSVDKRAAGEPWIVYDPSEVVLKVCKYLVDESGKKFEKRLKARANC